MNNFVPLLTEEIMDIPHTITSDSTSISNFSSHLLLVVCFIACVEVWSVLVWVLSTNWSLNFIPESKVLGLYNQYLSIRKYDTTKYVQFHGLMLNQRCYSFFTSFKLIQKYLNSNDEKKVKFTSSGIKGHEPFLLCTWESTLSCSRTIPCLIICALRCCTSSVWTSYTSINYKP